MILLDHYLWSHVARCSRRVRFVIRPDSLCYSEISDSKISPFVEDEILWFDIAMYHIVVM